MKETNRTSFVTLLALLFIALKLTNVIAWSWLWVLSPIWISVSLAVLIFTIVFIIEIKNFKNEE